MSFTKLETRLWLMCTLVSIETCCFANFSICYLAYFLFVREIIKKDHTRSFFTIF